MKVRIDIDCEDVSDLINHFRSIKEAIHFACNRDQIDTIGGEFLPGFEITDSNCYGNHRLVVLAESPEAPISLFESIANAVKPHSKTN
jgi:hypothetical protein